MTDTRFKACRTTSDICTRSFGTHGKKFTVEMCLGLIDGAIGTLQALEGEPATYFEIQRRADRLANAIFESNQYEV